MLSKKMDSNNYGVVVQVRDEVVSVVGLYSVGINEKVSFVDVNLQGMVRSLTSENGGSVKICVLGNAWEIEPGMWVERTKQIMSIPVSLNFIGRIISPTGVMLYSFIKRVGITLSRLYSDLLLMFDLSNTSKMPGGSSFLRLAKMKDRRYYYIGRAERGSCGSRRDLEYDNIGHRMDDACKGKTLQAGVEFHDGVYRVYADKYGNIAALQIHVITHTRVRGSDYAALLVNGDKQYIDVRGIIASVNPNTPDGAIVIKGCYLKQPTLSAVQNFLDSYGDRVLHDLSNSEMSLVREPSDLYTGSLTKGDLEKKIKIILPRDSFEDLDL